MKKLFAICLCILFFIIGCDNNNNKTNTKVKKTEKTDTKIGKTVKKIESQKFPNMLKKNLINAKDKDVPFKSIAAKKYFLFYFSAHWCPPCRKFTPKFVEWYNKKTDKNFEVIFVSSDKNNKKMLEYMTETKMPWLAIKHSSPVRKLIQNKFGGPGIPCMALVSYQGEIVVHSFKNGKYAMPLKVLEKIAKLAK